MSVELRERVTRVELGAAAAGAADPTFERAARYGEGWIMAGGPAAAFSEGREKLRAAFRQAGAGDGDGRPLELGVVCARTEPDVEQRFDLGASAGPVDVGVDAADHAASGHGLHATADGVCRQVDQAGDLLVGRASVCLEHLQDSHVCLVEAAVSAVVGFGVHRRGDYPRRVCRQARASERQRRGSASRAGRRATAATPSFGSVRPGEGCREPAVRLGRLRDATRRRRRDRQSADQRPARSGPDCCRGPGIGPVGRCEPAGDGARGARHARSSSVGGAARRLHQRGARVRRGAAGPRRCLSPADRSVRRRAREPRAHGALPGRPAGPPRAARLAIHADARLKTDYQLGWEGVQPALRESGGGVEVGYTVGARLRALSPRRGSLTVALNPVVSWAIELVGGVSGLRADLRDLQVSGIAISGGASDVVLDLPRPRDRLSLRVEGGVSGAHVRRPADTAVVVEIEGGASRMTLDGTKLGAVGGLVRQRAPREVSRDGEIAIRVLGGASQLEIDAHERVQG